MSVRNLYTYFGHCWRVRRQSEGTTCGKPSEIVERNRKNRQAAVSSQLRIPSLTPSQISLTFGSLDWLGRRFRRAAPRLRLVASRHESLRPSQAHSIGVAQPGARSHTIERISASPRLPPASAARPVFRDRGTCHSARRRPRDPRCRVILPQLLRRPEPTAALTPRPTVQ